jgi:hypothetical protein
MVLILFADTEQKFIKIGKDEEFKYYIMINDDDLGVRYLKLPISCKNYLKLTDDEVYDLGGELSHWSFKQFD